MIFINRKSLTCICGQKKNIDSNYCLSTTISFQTSIPQVLFSQKKILGSQRTSIIQNVSRVRENKEGVDKNICENIS